FNADVAVKDGKIFAIGKLIGYNAPKIIDAKKMIVAPGFIDVHAHVESSILQNPDAGNYIFDGVTTVVTGNCGSSVNDLQSFFHRLDSVHTAINVASLVGHNNVREQVMQRENRPPTTAE